MIAQWDDQTIGSRLDYPCFKEHYRMIAINLNKQQVLDADPKAIQQISFTDNLEEKATIFFPEETMRVLWIYFVLIKYQ